MGKSFTFYLKGASQPITIADVHESRTVGELKHDIAALLKSRDPLSFHTESDCVIFNPSELACIKISNYIQPNKIGIDDMLTQDEIVESICNEGNAVSFEDLGVNNDAFFEDEPDTPELPSVRPPLSPDARVDQARAAFITEIDSFMDSQPTPESEPTQDMESTLMSGIKKAKTRRRPTDAPVIINIDSELDDDDTN